MVAPKLKAVIMDMDGVLWKENTPLLDLPKAFRDIEAMGLKAILATNNSMLSRQDYVTKFQKLGVPLSERQIFNSANAAGAYLRKAIPLGSHVYAIGESGLMASIREAGFDIGETEVRAVIVGLDRQFSYQKMQTAMRLVQKGALFIGTNPDASFPNPDGLSPGAGAVIASVASACGQEPVIIGKPSPTLFEMIFEEYNLLPQETLMVGDRLDTDILGGQRAGCKTALVLSGVTSADEASKWSPQPDFIALNLRSLLDLLAMNQV